MTNAFSDYTDQKFQDEALAQINEYRRQHGAPALTLDPTMVDYSKSRAAKMAAAGGLSHEDLKEEYGENASWQATSSGTTPGAASGATGSWYGESKDYNYAKPEGPHSGETGHFTALVWKATTKLGIGRVCGTGPDGWETYIVANFYPAGNMKGSYQANVGKKQA